MITPSIPPRVRGRARAVAGKIFTLVELLVVIAIISVLASMLLPALKGAMDAADGMVCMGNQKQIGYGIANYLADYGDHYPISHTYQNGAALSTSWHIEVDAYVTESLKRYSEDYTTGYTEADTIPIWNCPTDSEYSVPWNYDGYISYFGNRYLFRRWIHNGSLFYRAGTASTRSSQLNNPGKTLMVGHWSRGYTFASSYGYALNSYGFWNSSWRWIFWNGPYFPNLSSGIQDTSRPNWHATLHQNRATYMAADCHVEMLDWLGVSDVTDCSYDDGRGEMYFVPPPITDTAW